MTRDIHTLTLWIQIVAIIASLCATALPALYATFPWRKYQIGRLFMLQAITMAVTIDLSTLFSFWRPKDILVVFWTDALVLTLIALASLLLTIFMWRLKFPRRKVP